MLEIDEIMPYYICKRDQYDCLIDGNGCFEECHHTSFPLHAKNQESVAILEAFTKRFSLVVDAYGRLVCTEREDAKK